MGPSSWTRGPTRRSGTAALPPGRTAPPWSATPTTTPRPWNGCCTGTPKAPRLVCMDGINSMTGNPPDLTAFLALARANDALLYVDDAHGFGIIGERDGYDPTPYGRRGNAIVRWFGERYDHIVLTAGFSKAYSSLLAFVTCSGGAEAVSQGDRAVLCVLRPRPGGVAGHGPRRAGDQPATGRRLADRALAADPGPARAPGQARHRHHQHLGSPRGRAAPGRPIPTARGRAPPVRPRHLRGLRPLPGRPPPRGRLPHPADRRSHRQAGRPPPRGAPGGRRSLRLPPPPPLS